MPQEPKRVTPKVGAYDKPQGRGAAGTVIGVIVVLVAVLLILWLFTDIL
jgi:hypothetical protein